MITEWIAVERYCRHYHTDVSFIENLEQSGLIHIEVADNERRINMEELRDLECYTRWYYDLDINLEGIEVIRHLLQKVQEQQQYIRTLEARLQQYEGKPASDGQEGELA